MNEKKNPILGQEAVTDARTLGTPRMLILGLQHLFAMFGATVLVPILVQLRPAPEHPDYPADGRSGHSAVPCVHQVQGPRFPGSSFAYLAASPPCFHARPMTVWIPS